MNIGQKVFRIIRLEFEEFEITKKEAYQFKVRNIETKKEISVVSLTEVKGWYISEVIALTIWKERLENSIRIAERKLNDKKQRFIAFETGIELKDREIDTDVEKAIKLYRQMLLNKETNIRWFKDEVIIEVFRLYNSGKRIKSISDVLKIDSKKIATLLDSSKYRSIKERLELKKISQRKTYKKLD